MIETPREPSRAKRLKAATRARHIQIDELVMASRPFESLSRYARFLHLQHRFHGALHSTYIDSFLNTLLPGLAVRSRLEHVEADMTDLGISIPARPRPAPIASPWQALGWLYCCEGSTLGAGFLIKQARPLQLDDHYGARHLSFQGHGRGANWQGFVSLLDELTLTHEQEKNAETGARDAFDFYRVQLADCSNATA